jgi:hypothetical protein
MMQDTSWAAPVDDHRESLPPPSVEQGWLVCQRFYDLGDEIRLDDIFQRLAPRPVHRMTLAGRRARGFKFSVAPVGVDVGERPCAPLQSLAPSVRTRVHFFHYGVASVDFEVPLGAGTSLERLIPLSAMVQENDELTRLGRAVLEELWPSIAPSLVGHHSDATESYTLFFLRSLRHGAGPAALVGWHGLGKLLAGEVAEGTLDPRYRAELLQHAYSYLQDDLAIVDHNAALVLDPAGTRDAALMLEVANSQLLALRYYDRLLDDDMRDIYDELSRLKQRRWLLSGLGRSYAKLAHRVIRRSVEVREFGDLIGNSIKVVGDIHMARIYRGAVRRLRIPDWQESIAHKLALAADVYTMLKADIDHARSLLLEVIVVLLIVIEVVMGLAPPARRERPPRPTARASSWVRCSISARARSARPASAKSSASSRSWRRSRRRRR